MAREETSYLSVYLPYGSWCPLPAEELQDLVVCAEPAGLELLISCDANVITSASLTTVNVCTHTLVETRRSEVIDLAISTSKLLK